MKKCEYEAKNVGQLMKDENGPAVRKALNEYSELLKNRLMLENQSEVYYIALFQLLNNLMLEGCW
jgi:hypothetical protein